MKYILQQCCDKKNERQNGLLSRMLFTELHNITVNKVALVGFRQVDRSIAFCIRPCLEGVCWQQSCKIVSKFEQLEGDNAKYVRNNNLQCPLLCRVVHILLIFTPHVQSRPILIRQGRHRSRHGSPLQSSGKRTHFFKRALCRRKEHLYYHQCGAKLEITYCFFIRFPRSDVYWHYA